MSNGKPPVNIHFMSNAQELRHNSKTINTDYKFMLYEYSLFLSADQSGNGSWDWDLTTNEAILSATYMGLLNYSHQELPHTAETWVRLIHPEDRGHIFAELNAYLVGESKKYCVTIRMRCKTGRYKLITCRGTALERDLLGKVVRMVGIIQLYCPGISMPNFIPEQRLHLPCFS